MKTFKLLSILFISVFCINLNAQKELSLEDAVMKQWTDFYPSSPKQLNFIKDSDCYSFVEDDVLYQGCSKTENSTLLSLSVLNEDSGLELKKFPNIKWIFGNSFLFENKNGIYSYDIDNAVFKVLLDHNENSAYGDRNKQNDKVAYMIDNDLYYLDHNGESRVTDNESHIVSGSAYARQEFGIVKGTFWSPNGELLAFYQKDESNVSDYPLTNYNTTPATIDYIKYPMAGSSSEIPSVGVYNTKNGTTVFLDLYGTNKKDDSFYATNLGWSENNEFIFLAIVSRDQKSMKLNQYSAENGSFVKTLLEETNERYVEPEHAIIQLPGKQQFLWMSELNGFDNLYLYDFDGNLLNKTEFYFPITSFIKFSDDNKYAFVMATSKNAIHNHLYKINMKSFKSERITKEDGQHNTLVSDNGKLIIDRYSNISTPNNVDLLNTKGKVLKSIHKADDPLADYKISTPELFQVKSFDGTSLWCRMIKPTDFDENKKYPVLVYVYNGPHVQLVKDRYLGGASLWMYYMAEQGYIVFTIDGRGSDNRGFDFESTIHRHVGDIEVRDQSFCTSWLKDQSYTDENRFAVHGWSYGGFMTTSLMLKTPGLFEVGVGGGPVIDWRFYEVMYTERYMDTPQDNLEGYEDADVKNYVENLEGDLLLIHGVIDNVVVMQHNMTFQKACIDKGVQVDFYAYPGHPHNVRGIDRVHLMTKVLDYIIENNKSGVE